MASRGGSGSDSMSSSHGDSEVDDLLAAAEVDDEEDEDDDGGPPPKKRGRKDGATVHPVHQVYNYHETTKEYHCTVSGCTYRTERKHAHNMMSHLKTNHKEVHQQVAQDYAKTKGNVSKLTRMPKCPVLNGVKMSGRALQIHSLRLVTEHGLSFRALDYGAFQDIVKPLIDAMPAKERVTISSNTIPPKIPEFASEVRAKIIKELDGKLVSVMVDGCTRNHRYFLGVNVQYHHNGQSVSRTLGVIELFISATATNLKNEIVILLKKFKIPVKNIISFTTDSGANYILAGRLLNDDGDIDEESDWANADIELIQEKFIIQSIRCAAHTFELAVDEAVESTGDLKPLLEKIRKLTNFLKTETNARQIRAAKKQLPMSDTCTRWGSTYDMVESIYKLQDFMEHTLKISPQERRTYNLTEEEWDAANRFLNDLQPAREATIKLQKGSLTLGDFYAIWLEVQLKMEQKENDSALAKALLRAMKTRCNGIMYRDRRKGERLPPLFNYPAFNAAVFMDPRYFALLSPDQVEDAKNYLCKLWQRLEKLRGNEVVELDEEESNDGGSDGYDDGGDTAFQKLLASRNKQRASKEPDVPSTATRNKIRSLLDEFDRTTKPLNVNADVFAFWESRKLISPELRELAMVVLSIPATQVAVERLFSSLKFLLRPQRFNLHNEHVDNLSLLHANSELTANLAVQLMKDTTLQ